MAISLVELAVLAAGDLALLVAIPGALLDDVDLWLTLFVALNEIVSTDDRSCVSMQVRNPNVTRSTIIAR